MKASICWSTTTFLLKNLKSKFLEEFHFINTRTYLCLLANTAIKYTKKLNSMS